MLENWLMQLDPLAVTWAFVALVVSVLYQSVARDAMKGFLEDRRERRSDRREAARHEREHQEALIKLDRERVESINGLGDNLKGIATLNQTFNTTLVNTTELIGKLDSGLDRFMDRQMQYLQRMAQSVQARDAKLDAIHTDVLGTPAAVWAASGDPLMQLQNFIEQRLSGLEARVIEHLDPDAIAARIVVQSEFQAMRRELQTLDRLSARFDEIDQTLRRFTTPALPEPTLEPQEGAAVSESEKEGSHGA